MKETVEDGGSYDVVSSEDLAPLLKGLVGCDDGGPSLVAVVDQLKEEDWPFGDRSVGSPIRQSPAWTNTLA